MKPLASVLENTFVGSLLGCQGIFPTAKGFAVPSRHRTPSGCKALGEAVV